jgi:alpha-L-fucosidase
MNAKLITFLLNLCILGGLGISAVAQDNNRQPPKPFGPIPTKAQLNWHNIEVYGLIHFTPTTYQNKEWGFGDASPEIFNPNHFNPDQLMKAAKSAGMKGMVLVAKHHDGFCLWPTATTSYNISKSPWRDGKGDMVAEYEASARKFDLQFGIYVSAWDRNHPEYGQPAYAEAYRTQLKELYTGYGPLFISWHDGANGGDGYYNGQPGERKIDRSTYYEWQEKTWKLTRELQPGAVIFSDIGPDVRWVGNEKGIAPFTSWSTFTPIGPDGGIPAPGFVDETYLGPGQRQGLHWIPAECDVPLRPGWFYHPEQDGQVKSPQQLFDLYLQSVGRGAALNLGLAPTTRGDLHPNDVAALEGFGEKIRNTFSINLADGARIVASNVRGDLIDYSTEHLLSNSPNQYWATDDEVTEATLEIMLPKTQLFDLIQLQEYIPLGQRIDQVEISHLKEGKWVSIAQVESIGAKRIIRLEEPIHTDQLKIKLKAPVALTLSGFGLFREAPSAVLMSKEQVVEMPTAAYSVHMDKNSDPLTVNMTNPNGLLWKANKKQKYPLDFHITLQKESLLNSLGYWPGLEADLAHIKRYELHVLDGQDQWHLLTASEMSNVLNNPVEQRIIIPFDKPVKAVRLRILDTQQKGEKIQLLGIAPFKLYQQK